MQTANGEIMFAVGKDFTVTADQMLELLDRGELLSEGVRRLALNVNQATAFSAFEMYEFHATQQGTMIPPPEPLASIIH
jgi:hypothetical protein